MKSNVTFPQYLGFHWRGFRENSYLAPHNLNEQFKFGCDYTHGNRRVRLMGY